MRLRDLSHRKVTVALAPAGPNSASEPRASVRYTQVPGASGQSIHSPVGRTGLGASTTAGGAGCGLGCGTGSGFDGTQAASASKGNRIKWFQRIDSLMANRAALG